MNLRDPASRPAAIMFANRMTILRHRALRAPLIVVRDGVILELDPFTVPLPEESGFAAQSSLAETKPVVPMATNEAGRSP